MNRRQLLQLPIVASLAPLARLWPFEEVDWIECYDDPNLIGWEAVKWIASCEICYETATDDFGNGLREPRKFYRSIDGFDLIVCEHCTAAYLRENVPMAKERT